MFWKRPCRSVIVCVTKSPEGSRRRVSNITVSTVRKMCACNTAQPFDLRPLSSCSRGLFRPPLKIPPVQGLCPLRTRHPARGGRASCPSAGAGTLAGALCAVSSCRTYLPVAGALFAVWAAGSSLTRWAGQAAHTVGGVRGADWTPCALPTRGAVVNLSLTQSVVASA